MVQRMQRFMNGKAQMEEWGATTRPYRRRIGWRRIGALIAVALIGWSIAMFLGIGVTTNGSQEWISGRGDTRDLLLPMGLFVLGMIGLAVCLP